MDQVPVLNFRDFIAADGDVLTTTSLQMAAVFKRSHAHVLRDIRNLIDALPHDRRSIFGLSMESMTYVDSEGGEATKQTGRVAHYTITRDGFTLLAMGFTGKKALGFKLAHIDAFNAMAGYIKNQREGLQYQYLRKELEYKGRKCQVSGAAREMRHWQDEKPARLTEMDALMAQMQPPLLVN